MNVKTQALDRVLEALSPTLAAELDRVAQEATEGMEQELQARLQSAVRDAENSAVAAARNEIDRAVEQAKEDTRRDVTAELERQFSERLELATRHFQNEASEERATFDAAMARLKDEWSGELNKVEDERDRWRTFAEIPRQFAEASSQAEMLARFLAAAQPFAQGLAIYVAKADGLALWKSKGEGAFPKILSRETTDPDSYFRPLSVRGRTVGAICALPAFQAESLEFLAGSLERAIEAFGLRLRAPAHQPVV